VRTVQRWEREQGLPVHRLQHNKQPTVFAYVDEIDRWWDERRVALESDHGDGTNGVESNAAAVLPSEADTSPMVNVAPTVPEPITARLWNRQGLRWIGLAVAALVVASLITAYDAAADAAESERLYHEGRAFWKQRTPEGFRQALARFEQSIAVDADNAQAYAGLADTHALLEAFGIVPAADALPKAHAAAIEAVRLGPALGEAHASLAFVLWEQNNRAEALRVMERAIALDPNYATARHWYALFLQDSGRYQEAVREGKAAHALDPKSPVIGSDLAVMLRSAGEAAQARALLEDLVLEYPTFAGHRVELAEAYRKERRYEQALEQMNFAIRLGDVRPPTLARMATLQARNGIVRGALDVARRLRSMHERGEHVAPHVMVEALTAAGDFDSAFRLLTGAVEKNESWVSELVAKHDDDVFDDLKKDARWVRLEPDIRAISARFIKDTLHARPAPDTK
jgi:tetratricopeptide (TPR) repeat protein